MTSATEAFQAPSVSRNETPEPDVRQGRRNDSENGVQLLDEDGDLSAKLEACLGHIFAKYLEPPCTAQESENGLLVCAVLIRTTQPLH